MHQPKRECLVCRKPLAPDEGVERYHARHGSRFTPRVPYWHCQICWDKSEAARDAELDNMVRRRW